MAKEKDEFLKGPGKGAFDNVPKKPKYLGPSLGQPAIPDEDTITFIFTGGVTEQVPVSRVGLSATEKATKS